MKKEYTIYILECNDGSYYIGMTSDLEARLWKHDVGYYPDCYSYKRRPVQLVYAEYNYNFESGCQRERQLKKWSRKKKKALIDANVDGLKFFSLRPNQRS